MPPGPHVVWKSLSLHTGVGVPPSTGVPPSVVGTQSAGMVVLPMQISQRSHGFEHWVTWVQRGHFTGSLKSAAVQVVASRMVGPRRMAQQPMPSLHWVWPITSVPPAPLLPPAPVVLLPPEPVVLLPPVPVVLVPPVPLPP